MITGEKDDRITVYLPTELISVGEDGEEIVRYMYTYDANGNKTEREESSSYGSYRYTYTYDENGYMTDRIEYYNGEERESITDATYTSGDDEMTVNLILDGNEGEITCTLKYAVMTVSAKQVGKWEFVDCLAFYPLTEKGMRNLLDLLDD